MSRFSQISKIFQQNKFLKYGVPFMIVVVGGSFGLEQFTRIRFEYKQPTLINPAELKKHGIEMKKPGEVTLESEYEKIKQLDIDNWEPIRGPRPWEEETLVQLPSHKKKETFVE